jgi:hypothetical protein
MSNRRMLGGPTRAGVLLLIFLHAACGGAGAGALAPQSSATSASAPAVPSSTARVVVITELDDNATVQVSVGDLVQLTVSDRFRWSVELSPVGILSAVPGETAPLQGTPRVARAVAPGTVTLIAKGIPQCAANQPCVQFGGIHVTIVVR